MTEQERLLAVAGLCQLRGIHTPPHIEDDLMREGVFLHPLQETEDGTQEE